ncbi:MAG: HEAT repeat domain-containing protein [Planctomycetota bacterium]|jgi:hypothetical protein
MKRALLPALLVLLPAAKMTAPAGSVARARPDTGELLRLAAQISPEGKRARARLVNDLGRRRDEVIAGLKHEDDDVRASAAWTLGHSAKPEAVAALTGALRDSNIGVARAAAVGLAKSKSAEEPVRELLADPDPKLRWYALTCISYANLRGFDGDLERLAQNDPKGFLRAEAVRMLGRRGGADATEALIRCLADPYPRVRSFARSALDRRLGGRMFRPGSPVRARAVEALLQVLAKHGDRPYATSAATELLTQLAVRPLGTDPAKWRTFMAAGEEEGR